MNRKYVSTSREALGSRNDQKKISIMADNYAESATAQPPTKENAELRQTSSKAIPASTSKHAPYRTHFNPNSSNSGTVLLFVFLNLNVLLSALIPRFLTQSQNKNDKLNVRYDASI